MSISQCDRAGARRIARGLGVEPESTAGDRADAGSRR
jgi:hypothetical protein